MGRLAKMMIAMGKSNDATNCRRNCSEHMFTPRFYTRLPLPPKVGKFRQEEQVDIASPSESAGDVVLDGNISNNRPSLLHPYLHLPFLMGFSLAFSFWAFQCNLYSLPAPSLQP